MEHARIVDKIRIAQSLKCKRKKKSFWVVVKILNKAESDNRRASKYT